jgi:hypothetical protein
MLFFPGATLLLSASLVRRYVPMRKERLCIIIGNEAIIEKAALYLQLHGVHVDYCNDINK